MRAAKIARCFGYFVIGATLTVALDHAFVAAEANPWVPLALALERGSDLEVLFDRIEARAARQGRVTAYDVAAGMDAIAAAEVRIGADEARRWREAFSLQMARLSRRLAAPEGPQRELLAVSPPAPQ